MVTPTQLLSIGAFAVVLCFTALMLAVGKMLTVRSDKDLEVEVGEWRRRRQWNAGDDGQPYAWYVWLFALLTFPLWPFMAILALILYGSRAFLNWLLDEHRQEDQLHRLQALVRRRRIDERLAAGLPAVSPEEERDARAFALGTALLGAKNEADVRDVLATHEVLAKYSTSEQRLAVCEGRLWGAQHQVRELAAQLRRLRGEDVRASSRVTAVADNVEDTPLTPPHTCKASPTYPGCCNRCGKPLP
jgi:hypothetical protein